MGPTVEWTCVNLSFELLVEPRRSYMWALDFPVQYLDDVCHTIEVPATELQNKLVCLLMLKDFRLLK